MTAFSDKFRGWGSDPSSGSTMDTLTSYHSNCVSSSSHEPLPCPESSSPPAQDLSPLLERLVGDGSDPRSATSVNSDSAATLNSMSTIGSAASTACASTMRSNTVDSLDSVMSWDYGRQPDNRPPAGGRSWRHVPQRVGAIADLTPFLERLVGDGSNPNSVSSAATSTTLHTASTLGSNNSTSASTLHTLNTLDSDISTIDSDFSLDSTFWGYRRTHAEARLGYGPQ